MNRLKRVSSGVVLAALLIATSACKPSLTDAIIGLQTAAILANSTTGSNGQPLLSDTEAVRVVKFTTQALTIIKANQSGWQQAVKTGWSALLSDVPANTKTRLAAAIAVADAAIGAL